MKARKADDNVRAPVTTITTRSRGWHGQTQEASAAHISLDTFNSTRKRRRQQQRIRDKSVATTLLKDDKSVATTLLKDDKSVATTLLQDVFDINGLRQKILSQLPPRTLFSFTIVSKGWRTMINNDSYTTSSLKPYRNPAAILIRRNTIDCPNVIYTHIPLGEVSGYGRGGPRRKTTNFDLNFIAKAQRKKAGVTINHSSKGLLICKSSVKNCFYLYNPTIRRSIKIPSRKDADVMAMNLVFETQDRCKIFAMCKREYGDYSLKILEPTQTKMCWRKIKVTFPVLDNGDGILYEYGVYNDGAIYWPRYLTTGLLIFNVREEKLIWLPYIPQPDSFPSTIAYFGECRGYLRMVRYGSMRMGTFDMLELSSDYAKWYTVYHVDLNLAEPFASARVLPMHILTLVPGEEEDEGESCLIIHLIGRIVSYSFKHKTTKDICELSLQNSEMNALRFQPWRFVHSYPETMICPSLTAS